MILIENEYTLRMVKFLNVNYLEESFFGEKKYNIFEKKSSACLFQDQYCFFHFYRCQGSEANS